MAKVCSNCKTNDIDSLVWLNNATGEVTEYEDRYRCNNCRAIVDVIITSEPLSWIDDAEIVEETNIIEEEIKQNGKPVVE